MPKTTTQTFKHIILFIISSYPGSAGDVCPTVSPVAQAPHPSGGEPHGTPDTVVQHCTQWVHQIPDVILSVTLRQ